MPRARRPDTCALTPRAARRAPLTNTPKSRFTAARRNKDAAAIQGEWRMEDRTSSRASFAILTLRSVILLVIVGLGLLLRCPRLDERPMHNDEAVNAIKFGQLWEQGSYKYDPNEHHGPSLFYSTLAVARLTSSPDFEHLTETKLRLITVLFGIGLIVLLPLLVDGLGRDSAVWAGLFTAVSSAMVFYSRYYIHEMLLIFFAFLALAAGWRYWRTRKIGWVLLAGAGLGMMHATKETFVITVSAALLALWLNQVWNRLLDASGLPVPAPRLNWKHVLLGL